MIQAPFDEVTEGLLAAIPPDGVTLFTLGGGRVRGALLGGTRMVNAMRTNHRLGPLETMVLGRAYLCAGLLGTTIKGGDLLGIRVDGDGPAKGFSVEVSAEGSVRGWLFASPIAIEGSENDFDTHAPFGSGRMTVTHFSGASQPYIGTVALKTGRLSEDLAAYYLESEQTRTAFDLGIQFDRQGRAVGAGSLYFQALPGADEAFLARVDDALSRLPPLGLYFSAGGTREAFLDEKFHELFPEVLGEKSAAFACPCSRERFASFLGAANTDLIADLAENGPWPVETLCHKCGSAYHFSKDELEAMLATKRSAQGARPNA
jgi:molecular chaperone Hsp33